MNILVDNATPQLNYDVIDGVYHIHLRHDVPWEPGSAITAVDAPKGDGRLSDEEINQRVRLSATSHTTHIAVSTPYDAPYEMTRWARAVRRAGRHVWFRGTFNVWEGAKDTPATMTPEQYTTGLKKFIAENKFLFQPGDILDPLPDPENGPYWARTSAQGKDWRTKNTPNATTDEYNRFFVGVTQAADDALAAAGIRGVVTTIRSTSADIARRPTTLYPATVARMGRVTVEASLEHEPALVPTDALAALQKDIGAIEKIRRVPVVIGELGGGLKTPVEDTAQQVTLQNQFNALRTRPSVQGINYGQAALVPNFTPYR